MNKIINLARFAFTVFLVWMVYREAGIFTALSIALIGLALEIQKVVNKLLAKHIKSLRPKG